MYPSPNWCAQKAIIAFEIKSWHAYAITLIVQASSIKTEQNTNFREYTHLLIVQASSIKTQQKTKFREFTLKAMETCLSKVKTYILDQHLERHSIHTIIQQGGDKHGVVEELHEFERGEGREI